MAQVISTYTLPSRLYIAYADQPDVSYGSLFLTPAAADRSIVLGWYSPNHHWQVQLKTRRRLSPAKAASEATSKGSTMTDYYDPVGGDWYEKWPDEWTDMFETDEETPCVRSTLRDSVKGYMSTPFTFDYDFSEYDRTEYLFRVRTFDVRALTVSPWVESGVLSASYAPTIESAIAYITRASGKGLIWSLRFDIGSWQRDDFGLGFLKAWTDGDGSIIGDLGGITMIVAKESGPFSNLGDPPTLEISGPMSSDLFDGSGTTAKFGLENPYFTTSDGKIAPNSYRDVLANILPNNPYGHGWSAGYESDHLLEMDISLDPDDDPPATLSAELEASIDWPSVTVSVASTGATVPENAFASASWEDTLGNSSMTDVELVSEDGGTTWTGSLDPVPFDMPVSITACVVGGGGFIVLTSEVTVPSKGIAMVSWPGSDGFALRYDKDWSGKWTTEGESVKTAGRDLPVSRYGRGGEMTLKLSGRLLSTSYPEGDGDLKHLEPLKEAHDWIVRLPGGEIYRTRISSHDWAKEFMTRHKIIDISLDMEVLGYGLD